MLPRMQMLLSLVGSTSCFAVDDVVVLMQGPLVEAAVGELQQLSCVLGDHANRRGLPWDKQGFLQRIMCGLSQQKDGFKAHAQQPPIGSSSSSREVVKGAEELHPVFKAYTPPPDINSSLAGLSLDAAAGFHFTVDWFDPHVPNWEQYIVPQLLPEGIGSRPLRCMEIGCWEGRSTCYTLLQLAAHPGSTLVCVDPFDRLYPQFKFGGVAQW